MRKRTLLDFDWKFYRGDIPFPQPDTHGETYASTKAGQVLGAAAPSYNDSQWERIRLPHDWVIEQPFDPAATVSNGYLPRGVAWYRRAFVLDPAARGRHFSIEFDGAFRDAKVWLNGHYLGHHASGYTGFDFSISDMVYFDGVPNILAVRVDSRGYEGWWYEGGGLYRHVWLIETAPLHVAKWGVCARPYRIAEGQWRIEIQTELENEGLASEGCEIIHQIIATDGRKIAETESSHHELAARTKALDRLETVLKNPALWSLEEPLLHVLRTILRRGETVLDQVETSFGIRECHFSPNQGFFLNGKPVKIHGTCNHQNHAGVGTAMPDSLQRWRLRKLKEAGCNAYRTSHYPPTPELLDICDQEGILVLDENRYLSSSPDSMADLKSMVRRDRNHPSVILWSLCNEEFLDTSEIGYRMAASQMARLKQLDPTRPVTAGLILSSFGSGVDKAIDVIAMNYRPEMWEALHLGHPDKAIVVTETTAAPATRGIYQDNKTAAYCSAYDDRFGLDDVHATVRGTCLDVQQRPYIAGNFVWVGFNYRGERGPYGWPATGAQHGFLDLCGFPKDAFYLYQAFWTKAPMVHLLPHWNWPGKEGQPIRIVAYSNCESVELFLDGRSLGEQTVPDDHMIEWSVPYQPGVLRAQARRGEKIVARIEVPTSGKPAGIRLSSEPTTLQADLEDMAVVTVEIIDSEGRFVPTANIPTKFDIEGPGLVIGTGNGNPTSHEPDKASRRTTFNGLAQVLIQATTTPGEIVLTATAVGLSSAEIKITTRPAQRRPFLSAPSSLHLVEHWRRSPFIDEAPDPSGPSYDPSAWEAVVPLTGFPNFLREKQWVGYHAKFSLPKSGKWRIAFSRVHGAGDVFVNKKLLCQVANRTEAFSVDLPDLPAGKEIPLDIRLQNVSGGAGLLSCVWLYVR
jgi:beta-galactosidase